MKRTLALFLALVTALALCACGGGDTPPTKEEMLEIAETVYLNDIGSDYEGNIIAAKEKYVGNTFLVPCNVVEVREDSCILYSPNGSNYFVKAVFPVDELKNLNKGDKIHVVGVIADDVETEDVSEWGSTFTHHYIVMENAHFVDKITEVSGIVRARISDGYYLEAPYLTGASDMIQLKWSIKDHDYFKAVTEGAKVTISASDIEGYSNGYEIHYEIACTCTNTKVG